VREEIKRLRGMVAQVGVSLQELTAVLSQTPLTTMPYSAKELVEDLQQKLASTYPAESADVKWELDQTDATLEIDPQLLLPALMELFGNAFRHERGSGPIVAAVGIKHDRFVFTLAEPKANFQRSTENWGREPLQSLRQGHYGLGLYRMRRIIEAHGGSVAALHDPAASSFVTTITLPVAAASST
jgi:K+-sensing histidine kinase KdpD